MMLIITVGIDTNDNILPLLQALVPIENKYWWTWFYKFLKYYFLYIDIRGTVIISDREKGLSSSVQAVFENITPAHCCQYITNNVQT